MPRTVTVAGSWPGSGWVLLQPVDPESLPNVGTIVAVVEVELDDGAFPPGVTVVVPDGGQEPVLFDVRVLLDGQAPVGLVYAIPVGAVAIDLDELVPIPVEPSEPGQPTPGHPGVYPVLTWDHVGVAGGVAPLDATGKVPAANLPTPVDGGPVRHDQLVPQAVFTVAHNFEREPVGVHLYSLDLSERYEGYQVQHSDTNTVQVSMDVPTACVALIN